MSRICACLDEVVAAFCSRSLSHTEFPYLILDAIYVKAHQGAHVVSKAVVIATGVSATGQREVLGLTGRGLRGRRLLDLVSAWPKSPGPVGSPPGHL